MAARVIDESTFCELVAQGENEQPLREGGNAMMPSQNIPQSGEQEHAAITMTADEDDNDPISIHWKNSVFAVGRVKIEWSDEVEGSRCCGKHSGGETDEENMQDETNCHIKMSGFFCGKVFRAGRIGNMAVCLKLDRERSLPSHLICVAGPFWFVMIFITVPLIAAISLFIYLHYLEDHSKWVRLLWGCCTALLFFSLIMVSWTNPGILHRHAVPKEEDWIWNDQARTFRPPKAKYDPVTATIVEDFDHVCPWTGTAIGKGNIRWFRRFVFMVAVCLIYSVALIMF